MAGSVSNRSTSAADLAERPQAPAIGAVIGRFEAVARWRYNLGIVAAVVLLAVLLIVLLPRPLSPDVSNQLWIAHHLRGGARLYRDIFEVNPPLWFWMAVPIDGIAALTGIAPATALIAANGAAALVSLLATDLLLGDVSVVRRRAFLLYAALVLLVMPARDIGQRELLALIVTLPYAALAAARHQRRAVPMPLALLVGAGAAAGFLLKHYFLGVPVLIELWLLASLRRDWRPLRPETLALGGLGIAYAAAILWGTPDYLTTVVPRLRLAYNASPVSLRQMFLPAQVAWLVTLIALLPQCRRLRGRIPPFTTALLIAATGFCAAWLIQHKGWPYQSIPTTGSLALAFAALLIEAWGRLGAFTRGRAGPVLLVPIALVLTPTQAPITPDNDIAPSLAGLRTGDTFALISTEGWTAWPAAIDGGLRYVARYGQYWMLGAIDADAAGARDPRVKQFGRDVVRQTAIDYLCLPPQRIVVVRPDASGHATMVSADPLRLFLRDPAFARILAHYRRLPPHGMFDAYQLASPLPPPPPGACHPGL